MQLGLTLPGGTAASTAPTPAPAPAPTYTVGGLMQVKPLATLLAEEESAATEAAARAQAANTQPVITGLVGLLKHHWQLAREAKQSVEQEMLSAVRSRRGEYDPDKLAQIKEQGGSQIYMMLFATKARQLKALLADILVGTGTEKPWTLSPTPVPELPPNAVSEIMQAVYELVAQAEMTGMPMTLDEVRQQMIDAKCMAENRIMEFARYEAERAEREIEDMMVEGGFLEALDQFLDDLCVFKTAFLKGPVVRSTNELKWVPGADGRPTAQVTRVNKMFWERIDPFMIYPVPWARDVHSAPLFERHRFSRSDIEALIGVEGYNEDAIRQVLEAYGSGGLHQWLAIDVQKASAEGRDGGTADASRSDLIDALQYWGSVSGKMLLEWGMDKAEVPDETKEYEVEVWQIGEWVIKAMINPDPLNRRPYYADGFSRIPGAFWHNSLFDVLRDCQDMCNAAARALSNNMGIASGPQVWVNTDRLAGGEELTELFPWKQWQTTSDPMGSTAAPMGFFQPTSNANELMGIFERFSQLADEYSGVPRYMAGMGGGEGGAGRTASGMSMMITNASKQIKNSVASADLHVIAPAVERSYHNLLMYRPELGLQGDLQVRARGAMSLVAKEAAQVRLNEFLMTTANPIDMQIVGVDGRANLLRQAIKRLDVPNPEKIIPSPTELKFRMFQAQAQQMAMLQQQAAQQPQQEKPGGGQELQDGSPVHDSFQPA